MTTNAEATLYASLTDVDALEQLADTGLAAECIPTEGMREVVAYCVAYFHRSGRTKAPSRELLQEQWGTRLEQCQVILPEADLQADEIWAAVEYLRSQHVLAESQRLQRDIAVKIAEAGVHERVEVIHEAAQAFHGLSMSVRDRSAEVEGITGLRDSLARYDQRAAAPKVISGMSLGMSAVDEHCLGIHDGEICTWAAPPKGAKSWTSTHVAHTEWKRGRETVLYTLENGVKMSYDRLACQICCVDYRQYQKGTCTPEDVDRVRTWLDENEAELADGLHILSPDDGRRTPAALIRQAQSYGAKSVIVDQLSHIEHPSPDSRRAQHQKIADIMDELSKIITTGHQMLPLFLNAQINREGVAAASKAGRLELQHLAESAAIERYSSWVFGLIRSETEVVAGMATLQMLASRRMDLKNWRMAWEPWYGTQHSLGEVSL
ncbi:replicative DNA helicase [Streptomyces sp. V3I8]|uniref:DnaB-like helicase C-terminal domain-containing protein n=1 Tax=Streptomyces sp. V3I8 TaxID=3042279 RepID=UPI002780BADF|nr:DnaB-like helicase C-terminal domain-containing protein [Streptomyces sp. V3I8]MDQ1041430.1 replicative DNA helicase [Streptomyces sp. V3I8]